MFAKDTRSIASWINRRKLIKGAGLATVALGVAGGARPARAWDEGSDVDILNFALNLEYLEAEYYLRAVFGTGLDPADTTGVGTQGQVVGGSQVPFENDNLRQFAQEIALDEQAHVRFLRSVLGGDAVAEPDIDLQNSFNTLAQLAGLDHGEFNPFENQRKFLLGAFVFEDVGVTAYRGAAPLINNKDYLSAAAGILGTEAYHASEIRTLLFQRQAFEATQKISDVRKQASGADDDQGLLLDGQANIVPTDENAIVFARSTDQVLNIVYLGGAASNFGFFPNKLNGAIS